MKILVVGAGALGGYFGGRLLEKGEDVTFLVRKGRKQQLEKHGLTLQSTQGDFFEEKPRLILSGENVQPFDLILMSTKSYHLEGAMADVRPYVGENTMVLPVLNGISHIDQLVEAFGEDHVIGGLCFIESTLDPNGGIVHSSPMNELVFGERNGEKTERISKVYEAFRGTKANFRLSDKIEQEMWHKYLFITVMSGITSMMRAPIGPIREESNGRETIVKLLSEGASAMRSANAPIAEDIEDMLLAKIDGMGRGMKSSMQRDMEKSQAIEVDHLQGHLLQMGQEGGIDTPILQTIHASLKVYEAQKGEKKFA